MDWVKEMTGRSGELLTLLSIEVLSKTAATQVASLHLASVALVRLVVNSHEVFLEKSQTILLSSSKGEGSSDPEHLL
jgi:hypothetical protein